ncbi:hypothetical protein H4N58_17575 [Mumia sp. ZJ1417]|uniref:hypothetical protein n=1 Tax=Mumia sp. ZJ1417 TaxID=2708082 RepID=UPI00141E73FE|nr:hypothetical protein [Mumia sp. ZJ1417]QMW65943.1 hypothetical protein H4N58_17575 [Mumia sp. ZJ1417]
MTESTEGAVFALPQRVTVLSSSVVEVLRRFAGAVEDVEVLADGALRTAAPGTWIILSGDLEDADVDEVVTLALAGAVVLAVDAEAPPKAFTDRRVRGLSADGLLWLGNVPALVMSPAPGAAGIAVPGRPPAAEPADEQILVTQAQTDLFLAREALEVSTAHVADLERKLSRARERASEARAARKKAAEALAKLEQSAVARAARGLQRVGARGRRLLGSRRATLLFTVTTLALVTLALVAAMTLAASAVAAAAALAVTLLVCAIGVVTGLVVLGAVAELPREGFAATDEGFRRVGQRQQRLTDEVHALRTLAEAIDARLVRVDGEVVELTYGKGVARPRD